MYFTSRFVFHLVAYHNLLHSPVLPICNLISAYTFDKRTPPTLIMYPDADRVVPIENFSLKGIYISQIFSLERKS